MPLSLNAVASRAMDLYYQDFAPRDAFFDVPDFKFHFATVYSDMFNELFQKFRRDDKAEEGFSNVEMTSAWLVREKIQVVPDENSDFFIAKPSSCVFGFNFDEFSYSLDDVRVTAGCIGADKCKTQKVSRDESKFLDVTPTSRLVYYWLAAENQVAMTNPVKEVEITYVPAVEATNDNCVVSDAIAAKVIRATLELMFGAKNGNVVDESNDGNKNSTAANQANPQLNKTQQTQ